MKKQLGVTCWVGAVAAVATLAMGQFSQAQPLHLWDFDGGPALTLKDKGTGGLDLNFARGEGNVGGTVGGGIDVGFEAGYNGYGRAYRPFYVDASMSSTAGAGLTGSGFTSPNQFTIEALVKADQKTSGSAVNYIFQTRPGSDRGYYLVQDEDNTPRGTTSGVGSIVGASFADAAIPAGHSDDGHWFYIAAAIDLTTVPGQASADVYVADLTAGTPLALVLDDRTWATADPSTLAGATGIFGIGNFAIDRDGDSFAEASQEWFQGAIDYVAIYDGLLSESEMQQNLDNRENAVPEPTGVLMAVIGLLGAVAMRRQSR